MDDPVGLQLHLTKTIPEVYYGPEGSQQYEYKTVTVG